MSNLDLMFPNARLTELGKIKVGGLGSVRQSAKGRAWRAPEKHSYFTITTMNRGPDQAGARGDLLNDTQLMDELKQNPALCDENGNLVRLPIFVMSNDIGTIMQSSYVWYGGRTVGARTQIQGEGLVVTWFHDRTNGNKLAEPVTEPWNPDCLTLANSQGALLFKKHTVFNCIIASTSARFGGVYKFRTTSVITGDQLYSALVDLAGKCAGMLVGLPMYLFVAPRQVAPDGKPTTVYTVGLEMRGADLLELRNRAVEMAKALAGREEQMKEIEAQQRKLLVAPGMEPQAEAAEINEEFSPDTAHDEPPAPAEDADWIEIIDKGEIPEITKPAEVVEQKPAESQPPQEPGKGDFDEQGGLPF